MLVGQASQQHEVQLLVDQTKVTEARPGKFVNHGGDVCALLDAGEVGGIDAVWKIMAATGAIVACLQRAGSRQDQVSSVAQLAVGLLQGFPISVRPMAVI